MCSSAHVGYEKMFSASEPPSHQLKTAVEAVFLWPLASTGYFAQRSASYWISALCECQTWLHGGKLNNRAIFSHLNNLLPHPDAQFELQ